MTTLFTGIPEVDKLLSEIEDELTEILGRYNAQRSLGIFAELQTLKHRENRNVWLEVYNLGKQSNCEKKKVTEK